MISIVLPTYNRKNLIGNAISSVLNQTMQDFELIIVDDCSTDATEGYIRESFPDERIRYVKNEKNLGAGGSRNQGIALAKGEYIAFIDSDTVWVTEKLEQQMELFQKHPEAGMVYSAFYKESPSEKILFPFEEIPREYLSGDIFCLLLQMPLVDTPTMVIPRAVFDKVGSFCAELRGLEDYELSLRIAKHYPVYMVEEPLIVSYYTRGCVSENEDACLESRFYILREFKEDYLQFDLYKDMLDDLLKMCGQENKLSEYSRLMSQYLL